MNGAGMGKGVRNAGRRGEAAGMQTLDCTFALLRAALHQASYGASKGVEVCVRLT